MILKFALKKGKVTRGEPVTLKGNISNLLFKD